MSVFTIAAVASILILNACNSESGGSEREVSSLYEDQSKTSKILSSLDALPASDYELKLTPVATNNNENSPRVKYVGDFTIKGKPHRILYFQLEEIGERDNEGASNKSLQAFQEAKYSTKMYISAEGASLEDLENALQFWKLTIWYLSDGEELPAEGEIFVLPAKKWATPRISIAS